jgi:L-threonylcarbamoyladenylate synthase
MRTTQRITIEQIQTAADLLIDGKLVAFPTETVYGLGADALNPQAVAKIFEAKGRPSDNPLIAHIASLEQLKQLAREASPLAKILMERFWPGPLTLVMDKVADLSDALTAGLDTVAVRMPEDPIALDLIRRVGRPIVAPSANRSGRPSATTWESVLIDLDGRIDGVLCGPPTRIGLESTVVDTTTGEPLILRHGAITQEMIQRVWSSCRSSSSHLGPISDSNGPSPAEVPLDFARRSPGTRHRHYQPKARVVLFDSIDQLGELPHAVGILGIAPKNDIPAIESDLSEKYPGVKLCMCSSLDDYAGRLFEFFRECDFENVPTIYCQRVELSGLGRAIMDRLDRAAG